MLVSAQRMPYASWMQLTSSLIPQTIATIARTVSLCSIAMVVITCAIVILRYGFSAGWIAVQESVIYLHALCFMLMSAYTLQRDEHVRVDIFYAKLSVRYQALVNLIGTCVCLFPVCLFILVMSWEYVVTSWQLLESSQEAGGLPLVFVLKSLIPLFCITMLLQGICDLHRYWVQFSHPPADAAHASHTANATARTL